MLFEKLYEEWKTALSDLKENASTNHPMVVMAFPIEWAATGVDGSRALEKGRSFVLNVFTEGMKADADSDAGKQMANRLLCQATNALWFVLVAEYKRGVEMGHVQELEAKELLAKPHTEVYRQLIKRAVDKKYDYILLLKDLIGKYGLDPFPEADFNRLPPETRQLIGIGM